VSGKIFKATSNDIAQAAGGPMGSPVVENWVRYFTSAGAAKAACEKDYKKPIKWERVIRRTEEWVSGDLGHVEYEIEPIKIEG